MSLLLSLRSEILKTKRTSSLYLTLVAAAIIPLMFVFNSFSHGLPDEDESNKDPLNAIFKLSSEINGLAIFPLFIVVISTLIPQIEYRNHAWKQVLTSPQKKINVFIAKLLNVHLFIILFLAVTHLLMWVVAVAIHFIQPELDILHRSFNINIPLNNYVNSYVCMLALIMIQSWMGIRFKNFIVPMGIGLGLYLTGMIMAFTLNSGLAEYFPYSFHIYGVTPQMKPKLSQVEWTSLSYALIFLAGGFLDFRRKVIIK